jgi:uncharacterized membrane protein YbhN (UPF0104 family)
MTKIVYFIGFFVGIYLLYYAIRDTSLFKGLLAAVLTVISYNRLTSQT